MRLLNTKTLKLEDFSSKTLPPYAILSHTWEASGEIDYEQWTSVWKRLKRTARNNKVTQLCRLAREHNLSYAWIDTCCINKQSSTELDEAINSMFEWYRTSAVCFVYLADLSEHATLEAGLAGCRWITRGWTLQELIAPSNVKFYDTKWKYRGTKSEHQQVLSSCTGVPAAILSGVQSLESCSVNTRMQWAMKRRTTRPEDRAYCLLGIFDVNMSHIYGEGEKAFLRLQERIQHRHQTMSALTHVTGGSYAKSSPMSFLVTSKVHTLCVPFELMSSYRNSDMYPTNLIDKRHTFEQFTGQENLYDDISRACIGEEHPASVAFQDFHTDNQNDMYEEITNESSLLLQLGDESRLSPPGGFITKEDPQTRVIFLSIAKHDARLQLTRSMLVRVLSYHQVPVQYLQSLLSLNQNQPLYVQNSSSVPQRSFWTQQTFGNSEAGYEAPDLARSGRFYEMVFGFQGVEPSGNLGEKEMRRWSIINTAFYHKLDIVHGTALWIVTRPDWNCERILREAHKISRGKRSHTVGPIGDSFVFGLTVHILLASWASDSWWSYLQHLEDQFQTKIYPDHELNSYRTRYTTGDFRQIQHFQKKISEAIGTLQSNQRTLIALTEFYKTLCTHTQFPQAKDVADAMEDFLNRIKNLKEKSRDLEARAHYLSKASEDLKQLILQIMNTQTSDHMYDLSSQTKKDSKSILLFTTVTLIFLPASFISSFFSMSTFSGDPFNPLPSKTALWMLGFSVCCALVGVAYVWGWQPTKRRNQLLVEQPIGDLSMTKPRRRGHSHIANTMPVSSRQYI